MKSENLKIQYQKATNILLNLLKYYERSERILSNGNEYKNFILSLCGHA